MKLNILIIENFVKKICALTSFHSDFSRSKDVNQNFCYNNGIGVGLNSFLVETFAC